MFIITLKILEHLFHFSQLTSKPFTVVPLNYGLTLQRGMYVWYVPELELVVSSDIAYISRVLVKSNDAAISAVRLS